MMTVFSAMSVWSVGEMPEFAGEASEYGYFVMDSDFYMFASENEMLAYHERKIALARMNLENAELAVEHVLATADEIRQADEAIARRIDERIFIPDPDYNYRCTTDSRAIAERAELATEIVRELLAEGVPQEDLVGELLPRLRKVIPSNVRVFADTDERIEYYKHIAAEAKVALEEAESTLESILAAIEESQELTGVAPLQTFDWCGACGSNYVISIASWPDYTYAMGGGVCIYRRYINHAMHCHLGCQRTWPWWIFVRSGTMPHTFVNNVCVRCRMHITGLRADDAYCS